MSKIGIITKAWLQVWNGITTKEHKRRAVICEGCPSRKYKKYLDFIDDDLKQVKGFICGECGCVLIAKIRSEENCPLNKW